MYSLRCNLALPIPLGKWHWTQLAHTGWFYSKEEEALYRYNGIAWSRHRQTPSRTRTRKFHLAGQPTVNPEASHLQVASILHHRSFYILTGVAEMTPGINQVEDTWYDNLQNEPIGQDWQLQITITGSPDQILDDIQEGKAVAVSDGSDQHSTGVVAWIIEGATSCHRIQGMMLTLGNPEDHSAFRSEAARLYSILITMQRLLATDPTVNGKLNIACNGHSVLDCLWSKKLVNPFMAHSNLLNACKNMEKIYHAR